MLVKYCFQQVRHSSLGIKTAGQVEKKVLPLDNQKYRYLRFRAIGNLEVSGFNGNWDGFPYEEFENSEPGYGYKSFIGKRAHLEHNSALKNRGAIGDLPDAYLNRLILPEGIQSWSSIGSKDHTEKRFSILNMSGQRDGAIEVLMRLDLTRINDLEVNPDVRRKLAQLIKDIDSGKTLTCSMGTNCAKSVCSVCGNEAVYAVDYCNHLKSRKGSLHVVSANEIRDLLDRESLRAEWLKHIVASSFDVDEILKGISNKGIAVRAGEINQGLSFFELSVVKTPAYIEASALENLSKVASQDRQQYLYDLRKKIGDENILDLYELLKADGLVSSLCSVR